MFRVVNQSDYGPINIPGFLIKFSEAEFCFRMPAPHLGEHTRLILEEWLGYSPKEVNALYEAKALL